MIVIAGMNKAWFLLAWIALVVLLAATHIPQEEMPVDLAWFNLDKLVHVVAYGVVFALFAFAMHLREAKPLFVAAILLLGIAALDELTQGFVGRVGSVADWLADAVGVFLVVGSVLLFGVGKGRSSGDRI